MADHQGERRTSPRRWYHWLVPRFSLRTLLTFMVLLATVLGYWIERSERQRQVAEFLTSRRVQWHFGPSRWFKFPKERDRRINHYLHSITGFLYFTPNDPKPQETGELLREIARLPCLEGVKFDMRGVKEVDWRPLASAPALTDLEISGVEFSDADIKALSSIPRLKRLSLFAFGRATGDISALAKAKDLEVLFITFFEVGSLEVGEIPKLPKLKRLKLNGVDDRVCFGLAGSQSLDWLSLMGCDITDEGVAALRGLPELKHLDIGATCVGDQSVEALASMPKLQTLYATGTRLTFQGFAQLCEKGNVKEIGLYTSAQPPPLHGIYGKSDVYPASGAIPAEVFLGKVPANDAGITDIAFSSAILPKTFFEVLPHLTKLTSLNLRGSDATDDDMSAIAKVASLTRLELDQTSVSSKGLEKLAVLPSLATLSISEPDDWEEATRVLRNFPALAQLRVSQTQLVGSDLDAFLGRPVAKGQTRFEVNLNRMPLTAAARSTLASDARALELHLAETGLTDDDVAFLNDCKNLRVLSLAHNRITDKVAPILSSLQTLEALDLSDTGVSDATVEAIVKLPSLRLIRLNHTNVTDASVELLAANERIEELGLRGTRITDRAVTLFKDFPNLQALNIGPSYPDWLAENEQPRGAVSEEAFAQLKNLRALTEVDVLLNELTPANVATLRAAPRLQRLTSAGTDMMSENFEQIIGRKSPDRVARVWYPKNSSTSIGVPEHLGPVEDPFGQKEFLERNIQLTDSIGTDEQIEKMVLENKVLQLSLWNTDVTAQGIAKLKKLKSLRGLSLQDADFGDEIVPILVAMPQVRLLTLSKTKVSRAGIEELAKVPLLRSLTVDMDALSPDERQSLRAKYPHLGDSDLWARYKIYRAQR